MKRYGRFEKTSAGKGFYVALSVCVIAIAASALGIYYTADKVRDFTDSTHSTADFSFTGQTTLSDGQAARKNETGVTDDRTTEITTQATTEAQATTLTETEATTSEPTTADKQTVYSLPMGTAIVKDYSKGEMVFSATMQDWRVHNGIDFAGEAGENIYAIADGKVNKLYVTELLGTILEIDHSDGVVAYYCGLEQGTTVITGDTVKAGEVIGCLGNVPSETDDGSHLHFEIKLNGKYVDPLEIMGKSGE